MAKKVIEAADPSVAWAEKLWTELRTGLLNTEQTIAQIIHDKAWEPLGYGSFIEAWKVRLSDITFATELRPPVIYEMYRQGALPEDVALAVKGISRNGAEALKRQMDNGVPAKVATTRRRPNKQPLFRTVFIAIPVANYREWDKVARRNDTTLPAVALEALAAAIGELP